MTASVTEEPTKFLKDGRINPYYLLLHEQARALTFFGFFGFSRYSQVRSKCIVIVNNKTWKAVFFSGAILNAIYIAVLPSIEAETLDEGTQELLGWLNALFLYLFYFEVAVGWVAWGFRGHPQAWFNRDFMYRLDFLILVVSIYEQVSRMIGMRAFTLQPLRLLRVLKVMTGLEHFASVKAILMTLGDGVAQLLVVFGILVAFIAIFAVFGMGAYRNAFRRRCVSLHVKVPACASDGMNDWNSTCTFKSVHSYALDMQGEEIIDSGYPYFQPCKIHVPRKPGQYDSRYAKMDDGNYHTCQLNAFVNGLPVNQACVSSENSQGGFQHFDDITGALLAVLQVGVPDSSYDVLHVLLQAEPDAKPITFIFFISISICITFLMLGLFVAIVTGTFERVRQRQAREARALRLRQQARAQAEYEASLAELAARGSEAGSNPSNPTRPSSKYMNGAQSQSSWIRPDNKIVPFPQDDSKINGSLVQGEDSGGWARKDSDAEDADFIRFDLFARRILQDVRSERLFLASVILHLSTISCIVNDLPEQWAFLALDLACNLVFFGETVLWFFALNGFKGLLYRLKSRNEFLLLIVTWYGHASGSKVFQLLPVLRIFRLMVFLPTLDDLLRSAVQSSRSLFNLIIFVILCLMCAAVTGRYLIGNDMDEVTRSNFGSFLNSIITAFQLITGDSYSGIVYSSLIAQDSAYARAMSCLFILTWFFVSQLILKNLFVAIIIENFQVSRTIVNLQKPGYWSALWKSAGKSWGIFKKLGMVRREGLRLDKHGEIKTGGHAIALSLDIDVEKLVASARFNPHIQHVLKDVLPSNDDLMNRKKQREPERVLYCLQPDNPIRRFFVYVSNQPLFDTIVFSAIGASCVFLIITPAYERLPVGPMDHAIEAPPIPTALMNLLNLVFTLVFVVEFICRVMASGLIQTKHAYLKSGWNIMDTVVLIFAIIEELKILDGGNVAKIMRLARALRPLRLVKRNAGMKMLIDALVGTLYPVVYVFLFACMTTFSFSLIGIGLFRNKMHRCSVPGAEYPGGLTECSGYHVMDKGFMVPRAWVPAAAHFDTFVSSFVTLFQVNTIKYVGILQNLMDITDKDQSPEFNHSPSNCLFLFAYILMSSLFIMNLFVGFIVDGFNSAKGEESEQEARYYRLLRAIREFSPRFDYYKSPQNVYCRRLRLFCENKIFVTFSMSNVVVSIVLMLADHRDPNPQFARISTLTNSILFYALVFETALVAIAYGPQGWLNDGWKAFDLFVCVGSAAGVISSRKEVETVSRCFRIFRIIRLLKMIKPIRIILSTLLSSLPQLVNIAILLVMFWSMFAVVFVQLFSTTKYGNRLGNTANFKWYPSSLLTVYQMVTGDEWMILMNDCGVAWPECTPVFSTRFPEYGYQGPDYEFGDCGSPYSPALFVLVMLVCQSVMLNLFIGMILDNFAFIMDEESDEDKYDMDKQPSTNQVFLISEIFKSYDFTRTGMVALSFLHRMMLDCPPPLGFGRVYGPQEDAALKMIRAELNVLVRGRVIAKRRRQTWWTRAFWSVFKTCFGDFKQNENFFKSMSFEDFMLTIVSWRKHDRLPSAMQLDRVNKTPDILVMTQALIMRDFLWSIGPSKHRKYEVNKTLRHRRRFFLWSIKDRPYMRFRMHLIEQKESETEKALRNPVYRNIQLSYPATSSNLQLSPMEQAGVPDDFVSLPDAIRDILRHPYQAPAYGLESLFSMSRGVSALVQARHYAVCRFVDDRTAKGKKWGEVLFLADFSQLEDKWDKWDSFSTNNDIFFRPRMKADRVDHAAPLWRSVNLVVNKDRTRTILRKRSETSKEQEKLRKRAALFGISEKVDYAEQFATFSPAELVTVGKVRAIQSYLVEDPTFEGGHVTEMRIVVGALPLPPGDVKQRMLYEVGLQKSEDAVIQVLGFVPYASNQTQQKPDPFAMAKDIQSDNDESVATTDASVVISDSDDEQAT
jgi:hypothetical protein